jgi:hypothetical protein
MFDRIALFNGHKSWDDMIEVAKGSDILFEVPPYMFMTRSERFIDTELLPTIKQMKFKLIEVDGKLYLTKVIEADIIAPPVEVEETINEDIKED